METKDEYLEITASAEGGKHKVAGLAYSGGKMRLFGWSRPVVVDVSGMTVPETVPLLANHENHTLGRVGLVVAKAVDGHLEISGDIDSFTNAVWEALNEDNKVSLFVRYIDIATGATETRIVNKNK